MAAIAAAVFLCLIACHACVLAHTPVPAPETAVASAPGPAAGSDCFTALANMSDCLTYVEDGSKKTKPDKGCCPELAGLVDSNPICLCQLLGKPDFAGVKIDLKKALKLPSVCGVSTPPVSTCSAVGVPVSLPPSSEDSPSPRSHGSASAKTPVPAPGPAAGSDCFTALANMSDCLTYVEDGSNKTKPDKGCCPELAGLVDSNPICLCQLLGKPDFAGIKIDLNKALKLPSVCGVSTPPVSTCSAVGVPVSLSPSSEDSASPSGQPPAGSATSPTASKGGESPEASQVAAATPSGNGNGALSIKVSGLPFIFGLATAFVSIFF